MKTLAAASALAVALATAGVASAQDYRVRFGDLDLGSPEGAAQYDRRVNRASRRACDGVDPLSSAQCRVRFRAAALELLPEARQADYARARGSRELAMVPSYLG
jgi:UrcA family protein